MNHSIHDNQKNAVYRGIDLIKFICSLLVVAIHISPLSSYSPLLNYGVHQYLARLAVPFFFTASGFFVFRKIDRESFEMKPIGRYAGRIFRLYGIWCCIAFVGSRVQFWYLIGVVVAVVFIGLLVKEKLSASKIIIIVSILYVIGLLGDSYNGLIAPLDSFRPLHILFELYEMLFDTTRNGFLWVLSSLQSECCLRISPSK